jgi:hypothetical protein
MQWDAVNLTFNEILAIISKKDPNTLTTGDFWLNETLGQMYRYVGGQWNLTTNVRYDAPDASGNISDTAPNIYWLNPVTQLFYKRDPTNTTWIPVNYTMYPTDPLNRESNDLWWDQSPTVDQLYVWDIVNHQWLIAENFFQQATDPSLPPNLSASIVWYNPKDGTLKYILGNSCTTKDFISFMYDPTHPPVGTVWYNNLTGLYYTWDGANWVEIYPIISTTDPFVLFVGYFWYDATTGLLKSWNGNGWDIVKYATHPLNPTLGTLWYDTIKEELYQWTGTSWNIALPIITVSMRYQVSRDPSVNGRAYLFFLFNTAGCGHSIYIVPDSNAIFALVQQGVIYNEPLDGSNGPASGPMYKQLDVGTDGTPDERRTLHATIRNLLGKPNQQTYQLSNKCVGFNKINSIRTIYRMQAGWIRTGLAGNELFGIAALQQLYTVGTFDMLSFGLMSMYMKELEQMFASRILHQWTESTRELRLFQRIVLPERLLLDVTIEKTEQDIITNRASALWIQSYALAEAKRMLSQVRGKYLNLPGPNGSTTLNAQDLASQAETEKTTLMEELLDPAMGNQEDVGLASHFVIG